MKSIKISLVNAHSYCNKGDAAIVLSTLSDLEEVFPGSEVIIFSDTPEIDQGKYGKCQVKQFNFPWLKKKGRLKRRVLAGHYFLTVLLWAICSRLKIPKINYILSPTLRQEFIDLFNSDLIISCGGGYINPYGKLYARLSLLVVGRILNKTVVVYGVSVENLRKKLQVKITSLVLKMVSLVIAREQLTMDFLSQNGISNAVLTADPAFLLKPSEEDTSHLKQELNIQQIKGQPSIGMTIINWPFPDSAMAHKVNMLYLQSIIDLINYIVDNYKAHVFIFPQVIGPGEADDRSAGYAVISKVSHKDYCHLITADIPPNVIKKSISEMDIFIGSRMHSNIFSLSSCVPTMAIRYLPKTTGIMQMVGLEKYVCDIETIDGKQLINLFNNLWKDKDHIIDLLRKRIPTILEAAKLNKSLLLECYENERSH